MADLRCARREKETVQGVRMVLAANDEKRRALGRSCTRVAWCFPSGPPILQALCPRGGRVGSHSDGARDRMEIGLVGRHCRRA